MKKAPKQVPLDEETNRQLEAIVSDRKGAGDLVKTKAGVTAQLIRAAYKREVGR